MFGNDHPCVIWVSGALSPLVLMTNGQNLNFIFIKILFLNFDIFINEH